MNKIIDIVADTNTTVTASSAGDLWLDHIGVEIDTVATSIDASNAATDRQFVIRGELSSQNADGLKIGSFGQEDGSKNAKVTIESTGEIHAGAIGVEFYSNGIDIDNDGLVTGTYGIAGRTSGGTIENCGKISGATTGLFVEGDSNSIENHGLIKSDNFWGVEIKGNGNTFINSGEISYDGDYAAALFLNTLAGQGATVSNTGTITSGKIAIFGNLGNETVINQGTINGLVELNDGNDTFINTKGWVAGQIQGGMGDDTYVINDARLDIYEAADQGTDVVKSSVSYMLRSNFENLTLTGLNNIRGFGNDLDNVLNGNRAANKLVGGAGDDTLSGAGGSDVLKGCAGDDTFQFGAGFGKDRIADFTVGEDHIQIVVPGADTYAEIQSAMHESHGSTVIDFGNGDKLVVAHTDIAHLTADVFGF